MAILIQATDVGSRLLSRISSRADEIWTPGDFADLGSRVAIDKALQRLARPANCVASTEAFTIGRVGTS
jgi:hypothetical protein